MSASPIPDNPRDEELQSVAKELLGVDFSVRDMLVEPIDLEDDDSLPPPPPGLARAAAEAPPAAFDAPSAGSPAAAEDPSGFEEWNETADSGDEAEAPEDSAEPAAAEAAEGADEPDDYWDALAGWDWDEGADEPAEAQQRPRASSPAVVVEVEEEEDTPLPTLQQVDEFLDEEEFGAGLLDDGPPVAREAARPAPRSQRERAAPEPAPKAKPAVVRDEALVEDAGFGAGLGLDEQPAAETVEPQPERRRPPRRRRPEREREPQRQREPERERETAPAEVAAAPAEDEAAEEATGEPASRYRNIPTWEEAISYLLGPRAREAADRSGGSSEPSKPEGDKARRRGGRGRRRKR
jgi:hypothetical protein